MRICMLSTVQVCSSAADAPDMDWRRAIRCDKEALAVSAACSEGGLVSAPPAARLSAVFDEDNLPRNGSVRAQTAVGSYTCQLSAFNTRVSRHVAPSCMSSVSTQKLHWCPCCPCMTVLCGSLGDAARAILGSWHEITLVAIGAHSSRGVTGCNNARRDEARRKRRRAFLLVLAM